MAREGFYQEHVAPLFGKFPWECALCREVSLMKVRSNPRDKSSADSAQTN